MAAIAAEAGISKPILYRHFGDKSGLYRALAERHAGPVIEVIRTELRGSGALPERVRPTIDAYLATIAANHNLYRFLMHRAQAEDERTRGQMSHVVRKLGEEIAGLLFAAGTAGDPARAQVLGHAVVGMVQAAGDWWLDHPEVPRETVVDGLVQIAVATLTVGDPAQAAHGVG